MDEVTKILQNPIVRIGLKSAAPEVALAVTLVESLFGPRKRKPSAKKLLSVIDKRLANVLKDLATTESKYYRRECETRAHELLGILNSWEKIG